MEIGIIGLGKMGLGITKRLISNNHKVFGFDTGWNEEMYSKEEYNKKQLDWKNSN